MKPIAPLLVTLFCTFGLSPTFAEGPPAAPVQPVTEIHWGETVVDPYRWMEDEKSPPFQSWLKLQAGYTRGMLDRLPGRPALQRRIEELSNAGTLVYQVALAGRKVFYLKQGPRDDNAKVYVRDGLDGHERLLVDPGVLGSASVHASVDWFVPSRDGRRMAYGISPGGSEDSTLHVLDVGTGKVLAENITRARFGVTAWAPDGRSFFYSRLALQPADAPGTDKYKRSRIFRHSIGRNADGEGDAAVLGPGLSERVPVADDEMPILVAGAGSRLALAIVRKFVKNEFSVYAAPLDRVGRADVPWRKIADEADDVTDVAVRGSTVYMLSHRGASNFKLLARSLARPAAAAEPVIEPGRAVLKELALAQDALYVRALDGGLGRLFRLPFGTGAKAAPIELPFAGAIGEWAVDPGRPGVLLKLTGWTEPQLWYRYDPTTRRMADTGLRERSPVDFAAITSKEVMAKSADGTLIPLSIVHRRDIALDGRNPALLEGYGAYGVTQDPGFNPALLAWLERGGVYAVAHVRGGGEFGEDWHRGGQKLTKPNTIADFIACAEYLVARGYTAPERLAGQGGSAGGITVGGALTRRPELFAAIVDNVGVSDNLRMEFAPNGPPNVPEFGSVKTEDGFRGLYAMSAYHHVVDGTRYPAVLLTAGVNDPRVDAWQAAKMTARLQAASASGRPVLLRVDYDAGHGIGSTKSQTVAETADTWSFLLWQFGDPAFQPR